MSQDTFSSNNLNTVNQKSFPNHGGVFTCRLSTGNSIEVWKDLFLKLIVKSFQKFCHVLLGIYILSVKSYHHK